VLLDFKKAFDSVLLHKLRHYGIRGTANKLLCSFLSDRYQYEAHHDVHTNTLISASYRVPQESNLGPLIFLIYINDIPNVINSTVTLFADDTCLNILAADPLALEVRINQELEKVYKWTTANHITIILKNLIG